MSKNISLSIEFGGGLDTLFSNRRRHEVEVPLQVPKNNSVNEEILTDMKAVDVAYLVQYLRAQLLQGRPELFVDERGSLRPGILVLVNDTDWEIEGAEDYKLVDKDEIVFISTLHGG